MGRTSTDGLPCTPVTGPGLGRDKYAMMTLIKKCSAILLNKYLPQLKDSGSFVIPYTFRKLSNVDSLCDLGALVNLMPSSIYKKLGIVELTPTTVKIQ